MRCDQLLLHIQTRTHLPCVAEQQRGFAQRTLSGESSIAKISASTPAQRQIPAMNSRGKNPGGGGRVKVEAGAAGAHDLDATDAAIQ